jgi:hypothetical protein
VKAAYLFIDANVHEIHLFHWYKYALNRQQRSMEYLVWSSYDNLSRDFVITVTEFVGKLLYYKNTRLKNGYFLL